MRLMISRVPWFNLVLAAVLSAAVPAAAQERPDAYVLSVGVNWYKHPKVRDLKGCVNDGKNVAEFFRKQAGKVFGKTDVRVLLDSQASKQNIVQEMQRLATVGKSGDTIVLFLSGHANLAKDERTWGFCPHEFDPANENATFITDAAIIQLADTLAQQGKKMWIMIDACHCGQLRLNARNVLNRYQDPVQGGILIMLACARKQLSDDLGEQLCGSHWLWCKSRLAPIAHGVWKRRVNDLQQLHSRPLG